MTAPVCWVDTETTGLHPDRHHIWEVGLITPDGKERSWMLTLSPEALRDADQIALNIGRFHERHPQGNQRKEPRRFNDAPDGTQIQPARFARQFAELTHDCHLAGAVISFDEERLRRLLWAHGVQPSWHYHLVDVEALAAGYISRRDYLPETTELASPPWNSNELSQAVGVDPADYDRHTALGDARWAKAIYESVLGPAAIRLGGPGETQVACRVCGCTDDRACPGGCYWAEYDLCSACAAKAPALC